VIEHIAKLLAAQPSAEAGVLDVVVVGSGPAGLSAGLSCIKKQLSCMVLEKEHIISSTVSRYPKGKHFMAEPCNSQNVSFLPVFDASKEELVAAWERVVAGAKLPIKLGEAVDTVKRGDDGIFTIKTTVATYRARTVVLATGLRGKPRLLAVPGANLPKVEALLDDPAEWAGQHVLVVGGGDSAVEGAMSLADVGATVTLSYRGDGFKRCKQGNQKRLAEMVSSQKLSLLLESNVKEFTDDAVSIKLKDGSLSTIPNQRAFVLIGADTPVTWLEANNVRFVERPHLYALGSTEDVVRRIVPDAIECTKVPEEALAVILGKQVHKSAGRRMMSAVEHLRDEFTEVVTQVSTAFRLSDIEKLAQGRANVRTPVSGTKAAARPAAVTRTSAHPIVPLSRLTARPIGRSTGNETAFGPERTVITASPFGEFSEERTSINGQPLRPRSSKRNETAAHPKFGGTGPETAITGARLALTQEVDSAFKNMFDHSDAAAAPRAAPPRPIPPTPPQRRARTDAPASTGFEDDDAATALDRRRIE
jgi:thioredoxin reductase